MIKTYSDFQTGFKDTAEVVVVGSGAGGAVVAKELATAGLDVLCLEAGNYYVPEHDFNEREEDMMPALYEDGGGRATEDLGVLIMGGRCVGGSTVHNICLSFRPHPRMLERWNQEYGLNLSYEELLPYLERVERNIGVNQVIPDQLNENNKIFKRGADSMGWRGVIPRHNRIGCLQSGYCELGCAYNRKQSMLITYIPKADAAGARIYANCRVDKIHYDGGRVTGVSGRVMAKNGRPLGPEFSVRTKGVVLSGGAVNTPALMLASGINPGGKVGTMLHIHPYTPVAGLFDRKVEAWKGIPQTYCVDEFCTFYESGYGGYMMITGWAHPGALAAILAGHGESNWKVMQNHAHLAAGGAMLHDETHGSISLRKDGKPILNYWPNEEEIAVIRESVKNLARIYFAAGAKQVILPFSPLTIIDDEAGLEVVDRAPFEPQRVSLMAVHPQSSCPMAADVERGVVDGDCKVFGFKNLFVADSSVFPTSIGTPPSIPIMAFATRTADRIIAARGDIFSD